MERSLLVLDEELGIEDTSAQGCTEQDLSDTSHQTASWFEALFDSFSSPFGKQLMVVSFLDHRIGSWRCHQHVVAVKRRQQKLRHGEAQEKCLLWISTSTFLVSFVSEVRFV